MTQARQSLCRSTLFMLVLLFVIALVSPELGLATDLPIYGGLGGNTEREDCPKGWYLVGLAGKTGSWVDRIAPICAPWLRGSQAFGAPSVRRSFGWSTGGNNREKRCTDVGRSLAIQSWWIRLLRSDDHYVQSIEIYCDSLPTPFPPTNWGPRLEFGTFSLPPDADEIITTGPFPPQLPFQACPAGEVAVGIRVRAGQFIDAIGLICGPRPQSFGAAATKPLGPLVQAPSPAVSMNPRAKNMRIAVDMFSISKPIPGQLIPHGELVIIATAEASPTVGTTRYAELELRYLDAPSNLQFSYPYFHVITVDETKLREGYTVDQRVTGASSGRWQVRARFKLNTATGPWSAAVPFGLCHVFCPGKPPSAIQQTAPLPSSVTQTPAPSSSAPAQMNRSPFMVRPRGVEESPTPQENRRPAP